MNQRALVVLVVLSLAVLSQAAPLRAQETELPTDRALTIEDCIDYALAHHSDVRAAARDLDAGRAGVRSARSGYLPRVTASLDYSDAGTTGADYADTPERTSDFTGTRTMIGIEETLYDGGRTVASVRQASAQARVSEADLELTVQQRVLAVTVAYMEALRTRRLADIAAEAVTESEQQLEMIQAKIEAGDAAKVDRYPVEVQLSNSKLAKLQADNRVRVAANGLRNAMGLDRGPALSITEVGDDLSDPPAFNECIAAALEQRPELARSDAQVDSSKAALWLARAQRLPVPTISAAYQKGLHRAGYDSQWSLGVGVSMSIFDAGGLAAEEEISKARLDSTVFQADQLVKDISAEVEEAYLNLANALESLSASGPNVEMARLNLDVAREKYAQGLGITLEIVSAQLSYQDALTAQAEALYDGYIARAQLEKAMGKRGLLD